MVHSITRSTLCSTLPNIGAGTALTAPCLNRPGSVILECIIQVLRSLACWCGRWKREGGGDLGKPRDLAGMDFGVGIWVHTVGPDRSSCNIGCHPVLSLLRLVMNSMEAYIFSCFVQRWINPDLSYLIQHCQPTQANSKQSPYGPLSPTQF